MERIMEQLSESPASANSTKLEQEQQILTETGFAWREKDGVKVLVCSALEHAGFTNGSAASFELTQEQGNYLLQQQTYIQRMVELLIARADLRKALDLY